MVLEVSSWMVVIEMSLWDGRGEYGSVMTTVSNPVSRRDEFSVHSPSENNGLYEEDSGR